MAESTTSSTPSSPSTKPATPAEKQVILPSTLDNVLQPDAMRGSEQHLKDVDIDDQEQTRRDKHESLQEKK